MICGFCQFLLREEDIVLNIYVIEGIFKEKGKGFIVWLEDGKLNVEFDVLMQLMFQILMVEDIKSRERDLGEFLILVYVIFEMS